MILREVYTKKHETRTIVYEAGDMNTCVNCIELDTVYWWLHEVFSDVSVNLVCDIGGFFFEFTVGPLQP